MSKSKITNPVLYLSILNIELRLAKVNKYDIEMLIASLKKDIELLKKTNNKEIFNKRGQLIKIENKWWIQDKLLIEIDKTIDRIEDEIFEFMYND